MKFAKSKQKKKRNIEKQSSLTLKIPMQIVGTISVVMVIICCVLSLTLSNTFSKRIETEIGYIANANSNILKEYLNTMYLYSKTLSEEVGSFQQMENSDHFIRNAMKNKMKNDKVFSVYIALEPDIYRFNTPNGLVYYAYRNGNGSQYNLDVFDGYDSYSTKPSYSATSKEQTTIITEPYSYTLPTGKTIWVITISSPVFDENKKFLGIATCSVQANTFSELAYEMGGYDTSSSYILTQKGTYISNSENADKVGSIYEPTNKIEEEILTAVQSGNSLFKEGKINSKQNAASWVFHTPVQIDGLNQTWSSAFVITKSEALSSVYITTFLVALIAFIGIIILGIFSCILLKKSLSPIDGIIEQAENLGNGNLENTTSETYHNDELGRLSNIFENTTGKLNTYIKEIAYALTEISEGNLTISVDQEFVGDFQIIKDHLNHIIQTLNEMDLSAEQVSEGASQVSNAAQGLSQGTTEQASAIEELATTISEISEQIQKTAENAQIVNEESNIAEKQVVQSNEQMQKMMSAMKDIDKKSQEISKIIKTIEDIAFQTNILALNATVEAARAGSAGKGFAVVADEVRNLAGKSAEAAKNTTSLIEETVIAVKNGTQIAEDTASSMKAVVLSTQKVTERMEDISKASEKQADAVNNITHGIDQIAAVVHTNSATAEESAAASEELSAQASLLKEMIERLQLKKNGNNQQISNFDHSNFQDSQLSLTNSTWETDKYIS